MDARPSSAHLEQTTDAFLRGAGREFLLTFYTALRSVQLYPIENLQVQKALDELVAAAGSVLEREKEIELRLKGEFIFINSTRLRLNLENYASFSFVLATLRGAGVGLVRAVEGADRGEWTAFLSILLAVSAKEATAEHLMQLTARMQDRAVTHIAVEPAYEAEEGEPLEDERAREAAKQTYQRGVAVTKEVINSVRMGRTASVKKVKRAVQAIVDQVLAEESSLVSLTTLRDYDEYTFTHSVNVCIFAVSLGRKLGLTKLQLYDLGMAALFHDVGKSRIPLEVLNKSAGLSEEEWRIMQAHPWLGVLTLFGLRGYGEIPYRGMIAAFEHHMKRDCTGYPKTVRPRSPSIYSKIIAIADGFDAATTRRAYQSTPIQPDQVLKDMWENPRRGLEPLLVKAFINLIGVYPAGTMVILDTYELAIVSAAHDDPTRINRPKVRIISDPAGTLMHPGFTADLSESDRNQNYLRSIIKVVNPDDYGVRISDYFV